MRARRERCESPWLCTRSKTDQQKYVLPTVCASSGLTYGSDHVFLVVSNASWTPLYDLRATIGDKTLISLQYRATIVQRTGEEWNDVKLTLSTASPQLGSAIPVLSPLWISEDVPYYLTGKARSFAGGRLSARTSSLKVKKEKVVDEDYDRLLGGAIVHREAQAVQGAISTSYVIDGLSTIPSDTDATSQAHKVTIALVDLTADLDWIAAPNKQPSAFLRAKIKNTSPYLFLPGRANIFLDDNFVAKSKIEASLVSKHGRWELTLFFSTSAPTRYSTVPWESIHRSR